MNDAGLLAGVRVLDMVDGGAGMAGRHLADLGADVIRVEPPGGSPARCAEPCHAGVSLPFATRDAGKRSVVLDLSDDLGDDLDGRAAFGRLVATAAIVLTDGTAPDELLQGNPGAVVVSISPFGATGPYRGWTSSAEVALAMSTVLSRSGAPGEPPLMPPPALVDACASVQAAWLAVLALFAASTSGVGDLVDVSVHEAATQLLDPAFGIGGSAAAGSSAADLPRGRPDAGHLYPIIPCADGHVRICVLSRRQWEGMFAWLGRPAEFADPSYGVLTVRMAAAERLGAVVGARFAGRTRADLVAEGGRHGVPTAALLTPAEVLDNAHFSARGALVDRELAPGLLARAADGCLEVDGVRAGPRRPAPGLGEHTREVLDALPPAVPPSVPAPRSGRRAPLRGLRVLDLGVIVVGAEVARLLADQGAEVIKVESSAFPDGSRQALGPVPMVASYAWGHRNKTSIGIDLRSPEGAQAFLRLVERSDVVLSNFKPGTMESLGLGAAALAAVNPGVVVVESSAFGPSGPWSRQMGYGPLVRSSTGLTGLWHAGDAITIYPDHLAARIGAMTVVAALAARRRTGRGAVVAVSQAEVILTHLQDRLALESLHPGSFADETPPDAPWGIQPCLGDDEWCVVTVRSDAEFAALCTVIGRPDLPARYPTAAQRLAHRAELDAAVAAWTATRPPRAVMTELQDAGVAAGMMLRAADLPADPHLAARGFFREMSHPLIPHPFLGERRPAPTRTLADPPVAPAPLLGEQTRDIARRVLGLNDPEIDDLLERGVLEETVVTSDPATAEPTRKEVPA